MYARSLTAATLCLWVAIASLPAVAAGAQCAITTAAAGQGPLDAKPVADVSAPVGGVSALPATVPPSSPAAGVAPSPSALAENAFAQHVASAGAVVTDLGVAHGMRSIAARSGDQFMLFQVTADGRAGVAGVMSDITPSQLRAVAGRNVTQLSPEHGLAALFVRSGTQFQVFYVTPDQERVIPGAMWDDHGRDITRQQVADVPGAIPTVEVGNTATPTAQPAAAASQQPALPLVERATFGTAGPSTAPHLWMLVDPQCVYSVRALQMLQPYILSGRVQVSVIPLSVLDYEDHGLSTRAALSLLSKQPGDMVTAWESGQTSGAVNGDAAIRLRTNMAIADAIRLHGTPTFVWRKVDGSEGRIEGMPTSVEALVSSIAS